MHKQIRYQLEILDSPENLAKSLKGLSSETLFVKLGTAGKERIPFRMSRREGAFELCVEGEILRGKANTSQLRFTGRVQIPPMKFRLQRGLVIGLALLAELCALQLGFWFLPAPVGVVDTTLFVSGGIALLLGISTVAWMADFFLVRQAMSRERQKCQTELRHVIEGIFRRVQPVILDYRLDETKTIPA